LVELKRSMMKQTLDGVESQYNENELMMELAKTIMNKKGGKKWKTN